MNAPEDRSKALNEHMSSGFAPRADIVAACWHVRFVPIVLQKSPSGLYEVEICNYRIGAPVLLNRCCAFQPDLESIFLAEMLKILLQHNLPEAVIRSPRRRKRTLLIRGALLSEDPRSSASRLIARPGRSMQIL